MKEEYRLTELQNANRQYTIARTKWATETNPSKRRDWAEKMEFWGNKVAFLDGVGRQAA